MNNKEIIRLVGLDMDGTILNELSELTPKVIDAFSRARKAGLHLVVITGRDRLSALPFLQQLEAEQTVLTSGGAQIWLNNELISQASFTPQQTRHILDFGIEFNTGMFVDQTVQTKRFGPSYYTDLIGEISNSIEAESIEELYHPLPFKISLIHEKETLKIISSRLNAQYPDLTTSSPFPFALDINPGGGSKGAGLTQLADILNIPLTQTAVVGDSENDITMFNIAQRTYAMGNAVKTLSDQANYTAPSNNEDGVAWVLDHIMKINQEIDITL